MYSVKVSKKSLQLKNPYCPKDGKAMTLSKMQYFDDDITYECDGGHAWDITAGEFGGVEFKEVALFTCECGKIIQERIGEEWENKVYCQDCFKQKRSAWRMDSENSLATLEIHPLQGENASFYRVTTSVTIRPYPNPVHFGGMYGDTNAKNETELNSIIESFNATVENLKKNGLTNVNIVRHPEKVVQSQISMISGDKPASAVTQVKKETPAVATEKQLEMTI